MINNKFFKLSLLALILAGCARDGDQLPEVVLIKKVTPYHKVVDGDTVGSIARKYGMKQADLIKLNNLEQPYQLYDGQRLIVTPKVDESPAIDDPDIQVKTSDDGQEATVGDEGTREDTTDTATIDDINPVKEVAVSEYIWPITGGQNRISKHFTDGEIIIEASAGTPVKAIADGKVVIAGVPSGAAASFGTTVVVKHTSKKTLSIYAYLKEATVKVGQNVKQGTIIGKVGKSGTIADKPQLYFEMSDLSGKGRRAIDPEKIIGR